MTLLALTGLGGCASPAMNYYTLLAPPGAAAGAAAVPLDFDFTLLPIKVPAQADQTALVLRLSAGRLAVLDNDRWAAPLPDELRSALSAALSQRLRTADVSAVARRGARPVLQISIDVQRFEMDPSGQVDFEAVWSARRVGDPAAVARGGHFVWHESSVGSTDALVAAQQLAIQAAAGEINDALRSGGAFR